MDLPVRRIVERVGPNRLYVEGAAPETADPARPALLFVGGSFDGSWIFREEASFFASRGWPVYAINPRGFYLSRYRGVAGLTIEDYLEDIRTVRESLGLNRVILAGYSMGGLLMLKHAERHGAEGLILYDSDATREVWDASGRPRHVPHVPPVVEFWPSPAIVDEMWGGHTSRRQYRAFLDLFKQTRVSGQCFRLTEHGGFDVDLGRVRCPALIIGIRKDEKTLEEYFKRLNAAWLVFEGSSHGSILVGPRSMAITEEVARWLEAGCPTGDRRIFPHLGFVSWDRQIYRMRLSYLSGWHRPEVVIPLPGSKPPAKIPMERVGDGREAGEALYRATFTLSRKSGFYVRDGGGVDRPPGAGLYRPLAREIHLADGEFFPYRPSLKKPKIPQYRTLKIFSKVLHHHFVAHVMVPRNYSAEHGPYPVAVLNDGQNQWKNRGAMGGWHTNSTASALVRKGRCREMVLVGVESTRLNRNQYYLTPPAGRGDLYVDFLADVLLPALRRDYHIADRPDDIGIIGSSYGAHSAVYAGLKRPDVFGLIGSLSYAPVKGRPIVDWFRKATRLPFKKLYLDCGTRWTPHQKGHRTDNTSVTLALIRAARSKGLRDGRSLMGWIVPGHCHDETFWRKRIGKCLEFLFPLI